MFGWGEKVKEAHIVSHLEAAMAKWLQEPGNPVMAHVPASLLPTVLAELKVLERDAEAKIPASPAT